MAPKSKRAQREYKTLLKNAEDVIEDHIKSVMKVLSDKLSTEEVKIISDEKEDEDKKDALLKILKKRDEAALEEVISCLRGSEETGAIIESMRIDNPSSWLACEDRFYLQHHEYPPLASYMDAPEKINILLVGKTGGGKSSTANMLLNTEHFKESSSSQSVTKRTDMKRVAVDRVELAIIDSPGLFDTKIITSQEHQMRKVAEVALEFQDGIHAFLVVWPAGTRMTAEEEGTLKAIEKVLSDVFYRNCVLVLTKAMGTFDGPENTLQRYIQGEREQRTPIARFVEKVQNRVVAVENKPQFQSFKINQGQKLLGFISSMLRDIGWEPYTNEVFRKVKMMAEEAERKRLEMLKMDENLTKMRSMLSSYLLRSYLPTLKSSDLDDLQNHLAENLKPIRQKAGIDSLERISDDDVVTFFVEFIKQNESYMKTLKEMKKADEKNSLQRAVRQHFETLPDTFDELLKIERVINGGSRMDELFPDVRSTLIEQGHSADDVGREIIAWFGSNEKRFQAHKGEVAKKEFGAIIAPILESHFHGCSEVKLEEIKDLKLSDEFNETIIENIRKTNLKDMFTDDETIIGELRRQLQSSHFQDMITKKILMLIHVEKQRAMEKSRKYIEEVINGDEFFKDVMKHIEEKYTLDDTIMLLKSLDKKAIPEEMSQYVLAKIGADAAEKAGKTFILDALSNTFFDDECREKIAECIRKMAKKQLTHSIHEHIDAIILNCKTAADFKSLQESISRGEAKQLIVGNLRADLSLLQQKKIMIDPDFYESEIAGCLKGKKESIKKSQLQKDALEAAAHEQKQQEEFDRVKRKVSDVSKRELSGYLREQSSMMIRFHEGMMHYFERVPKELYSRVVKELTKDEKTLLGEDNIYKLIYSQMKEQQAIIVSCAKSADMCSVM